jgi:hypothetical protein
MGVDCVTASRPSRHPFPGMKQSMKSIGIPVAGVIALSCAAAWGVGCNAPPTNWGTVSPTGGKPPPTQTYAGGGSPGNPPPTPTAAVEPPAISGGTLLVMQDGTTAVAADPDRDVVWIVALGTRTLLHQVALQAGDEPGRVVEDAAGHVHVALRHGGALVSIDPKAGTVLARREVCPAPRGLAYDASVDALQVACMDGRLITLPAAGGAATRTVQVDSDLRDVVIQGGQLYVSRFRAAELLQLAADGTVAQRMTLPVSMNVGQPAPDGGVQTTTMAPSVAYRTVGLPGGGFAMLHQRAQEEPVSTDQGGYSSGGGGCMGTSIVEDTVTFIQPGTAPVAAPPLTMTTLAVDIAVSSDGQQFAIAAPGTPFGATMGVYPLAALQAPPGDCGMGPSQTAGGSVPIIGVAFDAQNRVVSQMRDPSALLYDGVTISLPGASVTTPGFTTFHMATGKAFISCASCHPEGGDDGRVWQFSDLGERRTQNIRGGVLARAPFHWSGDIANMSDLVQVVLIGRMNGLPLDADGIAALGHWMDAQPAIAPPPPADVLAVGRGADLFNDTAVGCTACHSGPQLSTHQLIDVGTGAPFKVPSLISVGYRAPYLHDGCALTLADRFDPICGGGDTHGQTSQLTPAQIGDLVAYLESL